MSRETGKKRILMIEDEDVFIRMFGERLKKDGYEMEFAENGVEGLKKALTGEFDLFIIDIVLPTIMGDEIIERIKLEEGVKDTPIIVLSASFEEGIPQKIKELQVNSFFMKTEITPAELSRQVENILSK